MFQTVPLSIIRSLYTVHSAMVYVMTYTIAECTVNKLVWYISWHIPLLSVQWINSWWWTEELSETCKVSCQNEFVKLVHIVGFIIKEICYDAAWSHERKITVAIRNFVNKSKSKYGINSHSSGMDYVYLHVNQDFVFKLSHTCAQYTWQWHSKAVSTPSKWQTHGTDVCSETYDTFQMMYCTCFPESLDSENFQLVLMLQNSITVWC